MLFNKILHKLRFKRLNFRNLSIGSKYGLTLAIVFILIGFSTAVVMTFVNLIGTEVTHLDDKSTRAIEITELGSITRSKSISVLAFDSGGHTQYITEYEEQKEAFDSLSTKLSGQMETDKQQELLDIVIANDTEMNDLFLENVIDANDQSVNTDVAITWIEELRKESIFLLEQLRTMVNEERDIAVNTVDNHQKLTVFVLLGSMIASILIGGALVFFISRVISRNLNRVVEVSNKIADGDLAVEKIDYVGNDEIGRSASAINIMSTNLRNIIEQITQISEHLDQRSLSLTQTAEVVMTGSEQVAATTEELSSGSEMQANNASELSVAMEAFANKVQNINVFSNRMNESSNTVLKMTGTGGQLMKESVKQMAIIDQIVQESVHKVQGLDTHSHEISKLVSVIKGIADQTNLLALNAAIEAARAGEHGLGFAVVADEVRALAEQVASSVTEITTIVEGIQDESTEVVNSLQNGYQEVERGTEQIKSTGETFVEISQSMEQMVSNIQTITENLSSMSADSQEMGTSIEEIASITEEAAAGIEQTSASSEETSRSMVEVSKSAIELSKLSEKLNGLIGRFNL